MVKNLVMLTLDDNKLSPLQRVIKNQTRQVYFWYRLGRKQPTQMIRPVLNLSPTFPREFYTANMLHKPLLFKSTRIIFTHANSRLDKFLDSRILVLAFGVFAKFASTVRGSSDKTMKTVRSGKASIEILPPHLETQSKNQTPLSDTTSHDSYIKKTQFLSFHFIQDF